jgi:carbonic anhydrase
MSRTTAVGSVSLSLIALFALAGCGKGPDAHHAAPHWSYAAGHEGPEHWGNLGKDFTACGTGKEQSPINITGAAKADLPAIAFSYQASPLKVINNGHTVQVNFAEGSAIRIGDQAYNLVQTHFHTPSEEQINGKPTDMVWHLVHKNAEGKLAVVAVLVKAGKDNGAIGTVAAHLPKDTSQETAVAGVTLNAADLLPANRGYYHFMGSLTTPPCSEGVRWYVLKTPVEASAAQIETFRKLFGVNARPVQPLNDRKLTETK